LARAIGAREDGAVTTSPRRGFNTVVTRFWSLAAPAYDARFLQRWVYRPAQDEVIAQLQWHRSRRVADIACGTGLLADRIERELHPDEVYGLDMSEGMLAQARARSSAVQWSRAPAEHLPFDDGALDAVVTTSAFHFFDQPAALREFHRVLGPGGVVAVATISPSQPFALDRLTASLVNPAHNPSPPQMRALFEGAGFTIEEQRRVRRPLWTKVISDLITVGTKS
jgi:ubiquinone/menaquinone biosynthesis C-methylase UbiE